MDIKIETYRALPCHTSVFKINNIDADYCDFGSMDNGGCIEYECQNMRFIPEYRSKEKRDAAVKKYGITVEEYLEICNILEDKLYVGACGWCS